MRCQLLEFTNLSHSIHRVKIGLKNGREPLNHRWQTFCSEAFAGIKIILDLIDQLKQLQLKAAA